MRRALLILVGTGLLFYTAGTALTQVQPGERAVVRRFGRLLTEKPGPGLYRGLPWGIEQVERVPISRVRRVTIGADENQAQDTSTVPVGELLTGDHNLVNVQAEIYYRVNEAAVHQFALQADRVDALVARTAESVLTEWVAGRTIDEVLLRGKVLLPAHLQAQVQERLRPYELGVDIEQASITQMFPPEQVKAAFDDLAKAQTEIRTKVNQAEQEVGQKRRDAEAEVYRLKRQAASYALEQKLHAEAEADSFLQRLDQYRKLTREAPDYLNRLWLDEMTRLYVKMQEAGRIDALDSYLSGEGLTITQFPLQPKKK
jgi:membrane protease subunit HflK